MNIIVCMKAVPSTTNVRMDPVTNTIIRDGRQSVINPFDLSALEEAVQIKEKLGGEIYAISMGIPDTERLLRDALARGANYGMLLSDRAFAGADTLATSYSLACGIQYLEHDNWHASLIICGKMAVDGDTAQIGPELATTLGIPCITDVAEVLEISETNIRVRKAIDDGYAIVDCQLPAVITVLKDIRNPRMPSIAGIRFGQAGFVQVLTATDVAAQHDRIGLTGSPTQVVKSFTPERDSQSVPIVGTASQQAHQIIELARGLA